ncbi:MAG: MarR family winged helix-turn-helix transcriptional regulator [Cyanobacteria bacterium P01_F01_bin.86]
MTRLRGPGDRRGVIVQLTHHGVECVDAVMPVWFERENRLLDRLSQAETQALITLCISF